MAMLKWPAPAHAPQAPGGLCRLDGRVQAARRDPRRRQRQPGFRHLRLKAHGFFKIIERGTGLAALNRNRAAIGEHPRSGFESLKSLERSAESQAPMARPLISPEKAADSQSASAEASAARSSGAS
jgi:hypothetical protein